MRLLARLPVLAGLAAALAATPAAAEVVISQVYGGGGNSGAPYNRDYVELFNAGAVPVSLGGKSVQYASATGTGAFGNNAVALPATTLQPGQYFLLALASGANGAALPAPDATGGINMSATAGKVALVDSAEGLACNGGSAPCTPAQLALIDDLVGFGNANFYAGSGPAPALSNTTAGFRAGGGCTDTGDNAADFATGAPAPRNSATSASPCGGPGQPVLSIADASIVAGQGDLLQFDVTLSQAAEVPVTFDIQTLDGSAIAGVHYVAASVTGATIAPGALSYSFDVQVLGNDEDGTTRTFTVSLDNVEGALPGNAVATGSIVNDTVVLTPIGEINPPPGTRSSPRLGQHVTVEGIVTARRFNNGFFVQTADGEDDGDPQTSEGLFVFTSSAPPATAAVGNRVRVTGTVSEYVPSAAPWQLPLTQLVDPQVSVVSGGNPLPAPVVLGAEFSASAAIDAAGRYLGMRVAAPAIEVVSPSNGSGVFFGVLPGQARPFREPGVPVTQLELENFYPEHLNPPVFDTNPERIRVASRGQVDAPLLVVDAGARVEGLVGVLDYGFETYSLLPDPGAPVVVDDSAVGPRFSAEPAPEAFTIASYNLQGLAANDARYDRFAEQICDGLHAPDIIGVSEANSLAALQGLAARIGGGAVTACVEAGAQYEAYLIPGPSASIHVGFLVKTTPVAPGVRRVSVQGVTQYGAADQLPGGGVLNDRPPLLLEATVHFADGRSEPVTVIANHLRSLINANTPGAEGDRVRAKRAAQASYLAQLIEDRQNADPGERIVVLGDLNAFEFNDGLVDTLGIITGREAANDEVWYFEDSPVSVPLTNLVGTAPAGERYSYTYDGNAQNLDHIVANQAILDDFPETFLSHGRFNADFAVARGNEPNVLRLSDHDPIVAHFAPGAAPAPEADLGIAVAADAAEVVAGELAGFTVTVGNAGPDAADAAVTLQVGAAPAALTVDAPAGWSCAAPVAEGSGSRVACEADALAAGSEQALLVLVATVEADAGRAVSLQAGVSTSAIDGNPANDADTASVAVVAVPVPEIPALRDGVLVTNLAGAAGDGLLYRIEVPATAKNLRFLSAAGTGNVSLYVAHEAIPTPARHDHASTRPGNNETVVVPRPQPGTWYVLVHGETSFNRVTLRGSFNP
ncbi:lamin tail domain-containing protein [Coralloluteibacterium thermophilus]|uniref:Lamin tail domain-containing protein n=1 Tax=Coralloluteibacterium thermophilum TaxID=2707049 RepID=A0ABV9NJ57_9GAMM